MPNGRVSPTNWSESRLHAALDSLEQAVTIKAPEPALASLSSGTRLEFLQFRLGRRSWDLGPGNNVHAA